MTCKDIEEFTLTVGKKYKYKKNGSVRGRVGEHPTIILKVLENFPNVILVEDKRRTRHCINKIELMINIASIKEI